MRKLIVASFLAVGLLMLVIYGSVMPLAPERFLAFGELSPRLLEDLHCVKAEEGPELTVSFSHEGFFYREAISVSISASDPDARIYYTTDGSDPAAGGGLFTEPLEFAPEGGVRCVVLRAVAVDGDRHSRIVTHSYFIGPDVDERFSAYVFSLSTNDEYLHGWEQGILVPGRIRAEFLRGNASPEGADWRWPANHNSRGRAWERPVHVEAFTPDGERVVAQNAGVRVSGRFSRDLPQKSLRLIARREYEPGIGRFRYPFFGEHRSVGAYSPLILSYDTLILRNDGNDFLCARLRTPLASKIAARAGLTAVSPQAAAAVFINGAYYGSAWITAQLNEQFLEDMYNAPERSFDIVEGGNQFLLTDDEEILREFEQVLAYAQQGDTNAIGRYFDIDNLLLFYAIRTYIADMDWPHNNIRIWRYTGPLDDEHLAGELDGRWRFMFFDADMAAGISRSRFRRQSIRRVLAGGDQYYSPIFHALVQNPKYAERFANLVCDMIAGHFSVENVAGVTQELDDMYLRELEISLRYGIGAAPDRDMDFVMRRRSRITRFFRRRPEYVLEEMRELFGFTSLFRIVSDGSAKINTLNGNEGVYFVENRVPVTPVLSRGEDFGHWLVNGERRDGENLVITAQDADNDGVVHIRHIARENLPPLFFESTYDTGALFGFTMVNPTDAIQNTNGLFLSDDIRNLQRWPFPNLNIRPGNTWDFVGRDSFSPDALLKIGLNFNPRHGEVIFLSNENGDILDTIVMTP